MHEHGQNSVLKILRQGNIRNNCQYKHLESIGHVKQKGVRQEVGGGGYELRELENRRLFKGKTEKKG